MGLLVGCGDLLGEGDEKQNPPHFLQLASEHLAAGEGRSRRQAELGNPEITTTEEIKISIGKPG